MVRSSLRPDTLEPLPGEAPKPPLRMLERREQRVRPAGHAQRRREAQAWLEWVRRWMG
jgi:hypothetical protein